GRSRPPHLWSGQCPCPLTAGHPGRPPCGPAGRRLSTAAAPDPACLAAGADPATGPVRMKTVTTFPRAVREQRTLWIPLSDGCRLAARLWIPEDAEQDRVPAIIAYLPYRRGDGTAARDAQNHPL